MILRDCFSHYPRLGHTDCVGESQMNKFYRFLTYATRYHLILLECTAEEIDDLVEFYNKAIDRLKVSEKYSDIFEKIVLTGMSVSQVADQYSISSTRVSQIARDVAERISHDMICQSLRNDPDPKKYKGNEFVHLLEAYGVSKETQHCLIRAGVDSIDSLREFLKDEQEALKISYFGFARLTEVKQFLQTVESIKEGVIT